jgi:hypothetical protein
VRPLVLLLSLLLPGEATGPLLRVEVQRGGRSFVQGPGAPIEDGDQVAFWLRSPVSGEARLWNHGTAGDENPLWDAALGPPRVEAGEDRRFPAEGWCEVVPPTGWERFTLAVRPDEPVVAAPVEAGAPSDPGPIISLVYKSVLLPAAPRHLRAGDPITVDFALLHRHAAE